MSVQNQKTILLVEDDFVTAMVERRSLEKYGYKVIHALSGEKAIEAVKTISGIDLILMDIDLGSGIDGTEAAQIILLTHDLPVVFLSSHTEPDVVELTEKITSYGYVVKSSSITVLDASIKMAFKLFDSYRTIASEKEYIKTTLTSIGDGVIATDVAGTITQMNPVASSLTGWKAGEALGKHIDQVFNIHNAITKKKAENPIHKVIERGVIVGLANHTVLVSKDGLEHQIADSASPIKDMNGITRGVVLVFRDVTEEYKKNEAIRESESRLSLAETVARIGNWKILLRTKEMIASMGASSIYGVGPDAMSLEIAQSYPLPEYRPILDRALDDLITKGIPYDVQFKILRPSDGKTVDIHSLALYDKGNNTVFGVVHDITDIKQTIEALDRQSDFTRVLD
jgi:PAS domain S-box-containing protein